MNELRGLRQRRHLVVMVRREHAGHRPALLWLHGLGHVLAGSIHAKPGPADLCWVRADVAVAEL